MFGFGGYQMSELIPFFIIGTLIQKDWKQKSDFKTTIICLGFEFLIPSEISSAYLH